MAGTSKKECRPPDVGEPAQESSQRLNTNTKGQPKKPQRRSMSKRANRRRRRQKRRFGLYTVDELDALPDPEWLIKEILPLGGFIELYGDPGACKSFQALDWAGHITSGRQWGGRDVKTGAVIYIYAEGTSGLKRRIHAWRKVYKGDLSSLHFLPKALDIRDENDIEEFIEEIRKTRCEPVLIIVDTLARCFGDGDENGPKDMNAFVAGIDDLRNAFLGATVLVVHHAGKSKSKGDRGHTALRAAADTVIRMSKNNHSLTLKCEKQKDEKPFDNILMKLRPVPLYEGKSSCVIEHLLEETQAIQNTDSSIGDPRADKTNIKALEALRTFGQKGAVFSEWLKGSGLAKSTFQDARGRLLESGRVKQNGRRYFVSDGPEAETGSE